MSKSKPSLYDLQHRALIGAMPQLGLTIDDLRAMAADLNDGKASLSKLPIEKRHTLIAHLQQLGAKVRNPTVYDSDRTDNVRTLHTISEGQHRMLDALTAWPR